MKSMFISVYEPSDKAKNAGIVGNFRIKVEDLPFFKGYANDKGDIRFTIWKSKAPYNSTPYAGITIKVDEPYNNRQTNKKPESAPIDDEEIPF